MSPLFRLAEDGLAAITGEAVLLASDQPLAQLAGRLEQTRVKGLVAPDMPLVFTSRSWELPPASGATAILLLGPKSLLCLAMLLQARRAGIIRIFWPVAGGWHGKTVASLIREQFLAKLSHEVGRRLLAWVRPTLARGGGKTLRRCFSGLLQRRLQPLPAARTSADSEPGRLLLITPGLAIGGAERRMVRTLRALAPKIADLQLFCRSLDPRRGDDALLETVRNLGLSPLSPDDLLGGGPLGEWPELNALPVRLREDVRLYLRLFRLHRPETVYIWQDWTNITAGFAAVMAGVPRILLSTVSLAPHHFQHYLPVMEPLYRLLAARPEVTLVNNSAMGAADYEGWLELEPGRVEVLRNGLADIRQTCPQGAGAELRRQWGLPPDGPVVGTVQRMALVKDPALWLAVASKVQDARPEIHFLLVGDGPELESMTTQAEALGLNAVFTGAMEDPAPVYDAMDLFLLTSQVEGLPNVLIEAQIMGRPVVAAKVGGMPEALADGVTGRLVDGRAPENYAAAILALLVDPPAPDVCRAFALERFGLTRMIEENLTLLGYNKP